MSGGKDEREAERKYEMNELREGRMTLVIVLPAEGILWPRRGGCKVFVKMV